MKYAEVQLVRFYAESVLKRIQSRYSLPSWQVYLKFFTPPFRPFGSAPIDSTPEYILEHFDNFILDTPEWSKACNLWELLEISKNKRIRARQEQELKELIDQFQYDGEVEVVMLWKEINCEVNSRLRHDEELVVIHRTPQIGGIKICLGSINELKQRKEKSELSHLNCNHS